MSDVPLVPPEYPVLDSVISHVMHREVMIFSLLPLPLPFELCGSEDSYSGFLEPSTVPDTQRRLSVKDRCEKGRV